MRLFQIIIGATILALSASLSNSVWAISPKNAGKAEAKIVYVLFSYDFNDILGRKIVGEFDDKTNTERRISVFPSALDFRASDAENLIRPSFLKGIENGNADIVMAFEDSAARAVEGRLSTVPQSMPILLCGVDAIPQNFKLRHPQTAAVLRPDTGLATMELAVALFPKAKTAYLVLDDTARGDALLRDCESVREKFPNLDIKYLRRGETKTADLLRILSEAFPQDFAVFSSWKADDKEISLTERTALKMLSSAAKCPVFSVSYGGAVSGYSIGGAVVNPEDSARCALAAALEISDGMKASAIRTRTPKVRNMVEYGVLRKFGLDVGDLPRGTEIINRPPSFLENNKTAIVAVFSSILILSICLAGAAYMAYRIRRQRNLLNFVLKWMPMQTFIADSAGKVAASYSHSAAAAGISAPSRGENLRKFAERHSYFWLKNFLDSDMENETVEWKCDGSDGKPLWRTSTLVRIGDDIGGNDESLIVVTRDITERRRLGETLKRELSVSNAVLETTTDAIIVFDSVGRATFANRAACEMCGFEKAEITGKRCAEIFGKTSGRLGRSSAEEFSRLVAAGGNAAVGERKLRDANGRDIVVDAALSQLRGEEKDWGGSVLILKNMTQIAASREKLEYVKQLLENAMKLSKVYYFTYDVDKKICIEECTSRYLHKLPFDLEGRPIWNGIHPDDRREFRETFLGVAKGYLDSLEFTFRREMFGDMRYYAARAQKGKTDGGENIITGTIMDITGIKKSQATVNDIRAMLEEIFKQSSYGISVKDADDDFKYLIWNSGMEKLTGMNRDDVVGRKKSELFPENESIDGNDDVLTLQNGKHERDIVNVKNRKDGKTRFFFTRKSLVKRRDGGRFILTICSDTTQLRRSEKEKSDILENIPEAVVLFDTSKRVIYANEPAREIAHVGVGDLLGSICNGTFCHEAHTEYCSTVEAAHTGERRIARKTIGGKSYDVISSPILDENGHTRRIVMTMIDTTKNEANKTKLAEALKRARTAVLAKSAFLSTMSHEIRTPLNVIIGSAELLNLEKLSAEVADSVKSIYVASVALSQIINNILDYSKLDAGGMEVIENTVRLDAVLSDMEKLFRQRAENKGLYFTVKIDDNIPPIVSDERHIRQIVMNFIGNALKFTNEGGIELSASLRHTFPKRGDLKISVKDTGIGISADFIKTMFLPFEREVTHNNCRIEGTGLGLAISYLLSKRLGGTIEVESKQGESGGSVFSLVIPDMALAEKTAGEKIPDAVTGVAEFDGKTALVVDDIDMNRKVLSKILVKMNVESLEADSVDAAMKTLKRHSVDVIITDLWMPEKSGEVLAELVRTNSALRHLPIFLLTADTEMRANFKVDNFNGIILKPVTIKNVSKALSGAFAPKKQNGADGVKK